MNPIYNYIIFGLIVVLAGSLVYFASWLFKKLCKDTSEFFDRDWDAIKAEEKRMAGLEE